MTDEPTEEELAAAQAQADRYALAIATGAGSAEVLYVPNQEVVDSHADVPLLLEESPGGEGRILSRPDGGSVAAWLIARVMQSEGEVMALKLRCYELMEQVNAAAQPSEAPKQGGLYIP